MRDFKSNEEFFAACNELFARLEQQGHAAAAAELCEGFACLNGLTDGWGMFMEAIDRTLVTYRNTMNRAERAELKELRQIVKKIVCRK